MTLREAHILALKVLKQVMEEKLDENNVQLAQVSVAPAFQPNMARKPPLGSSSSASQVTKDKGFQILGESELKEVIEGIAA